MNNLSESEIQRDIINYCTIKNCLVFRMNAGSRNHNNKQAPAGTPDLLVIPDIANPLDFLWIEVKTSGGKVTAVQEEMHKQLDNRDNVVIVARSVQDVMEYI